VTLAYGAAAAWLTVGLLVLQEPLLASVYAVALGFLAASRLRLMDLPDVGVLAACFGGVAWIIGVGVLPVAHSHASVQVVACACALFIPALLAAERRSARAPRDIGPVGAIIGFSLAICGAGAAGLLSSVAGTLSAIVTGVGAIVFVIGSVPLVIVSRYAETLRSATSIAIVLAAIAQVTLGGLAGAALPFIGLASAAAILFGLAWVMVGRDLATQREP
jgi:hypothetical protein